MHSFASCLIHCVWSTKIATLPHPELTGTPLAISWRHREAQSDQGARYQRSRRSRSYPALIAGNTIRCQSNAASERKFIQMDSRNISDDAFLCLAGRLRRIQRWHFWRGCNCDLYQQSNGAPPYAIFSRGVHSDAPEAPFRGINARLRCSIVPAGTPCIANLGYPALKRWAIFHGTLAPQINRCTVIGRRNTTILAARAADDLCLRAISLRRPLQWHRNNRGFDRADLPRPFACCAREFPVHRCHRKRQV
jgi:hypothetical protein